MKDVFNEDIFKTWAEAQKRIRESLSTILPALPHSKGIDDTWHQAYLKNLATWEAAVKQTLKAEATWVEQWADQVANAGAVPEPLNEWTRQMEKMMQYWIKTQHQLWEDCFNTLRSSSAMPLPGVAKTKSETVKTSLTPESKKPIEPEAPSKTAGQSIESKTAETEPAQKPTPSLASEQDNLKTISGIGPVLEQKLNTMGITTYRQIAQLSDEDIKRIETSVTKLAGRVRRDRWIEQAKEQHFEKYHEQL